MNRIVAIAAMDRQWLIGDSTSPSGLPWHCRTDLARFKVLTQDQILVVGRKTFEQLPKLPGRYIVVLSSNPRQMSLLGRPVFPSFEAMFKAHKDDKRTIFIGGGAQVYASTMKYWNMLELTLVDGVHQGDKKMPMYEQLLPDLIAKEKFNGGTFFTYHFPQAVRPEG